MYDVLPLQIQKFPRDSLHYVIIIIIITITMILG